MADPYAEAVSLLAASRIHVREARKIVDDYLSELDERSAVADVDATIAQLGSGVVCRFLRCLRAEAISRRVVWDGNVAHVRFRG